MKTILRRKSRVASVSRSLIAHRASPSSTSFSQPSMRPFGSSTRVSVDTPGARLSIFCVVIEFSQVRRSGPHRRSTRRWARSTRPSFSSSTRCSRREAPSWMGVSARSPDPSTAVELSPRDSDDGGRLGGGVLRRRRIRGCRIRRHGISHLKTASSIWQRSGRRVRGPWLPCPRPT